MRTHIHVPATYLKHFSADPSKGRNSIIRVFNKKTGIIQDLPVYNIGIKKNAFSEEVEKFHTYFEKEYDKFMDIILTRYSYDASQERLRSGMLMIFDLILRHKTNYEFIQKLFKDNPEEKIQNFVNANPSFESLDPWQIIRIIEPLFSDLITRRPYYLAIRGYPNDVFITSDNPVVPYRPGYGTIYFLPIKRTHVFCLGYYGREKYSKLMEYFLRKFELQAEGIAWINQQVKIQSETFYLV